MLVVAPETTAGTRFFRSAPGEVKKLLDGYDARLDALFRRPPVTKPDCPDVLDPLLMRLDPDARKMWIAFYNEVEHAIAPGGELASIRAFAGKMASTPGGSQW